VGGGGQKAPDRHPDTDGQTDKHTRQNLYILAMWTVTRSVYHEAYKPNIDINYQWVSHA